MNEKDIAILMEDRCTRNEAVKLLKKGTTIFGHNDFAENFDSYMKDFGCDNEEIENFKNMVENREPVTGWSVVDYNENTYYIMYIL